MSCQLAHRLGRRARSTLKSTGHAWTTTSTRMWSLGENYVQCDVNRMSKEQGFHSPVADVLFNESYEKIIEACL